MTALLYFLVAVVAVSSATQAWLGDRDDRGRQAFLALGWAIGLSYLAFALSLLPGLDGIRLLYMLAGCFVPVTALWTVDRALGREAPRTAQSVRFVALCTAIVGPASTLAHGALYLKRSGTSVPQVVAGLFVTVAFSAVLVRIHAAGEAAALRVDKTRLRYLWFTAGAAMGFTVLEQLARVLAGPVDPAKLTTLASRGVVLQGAIPPFSAVFTGVTLYLLYHSVTLNRLLDLRELLSHAATLFLSALLLLVVDGITFLWVDTFTVYPFHSTFQIFLASLMFLAAYDPLRTHIDWAANRAFNSRGQQLAVTLESLRRSVPTLITTEALVDVLLERLHASGRVPVCSLYLWDPRLDAFACVGWRGHAEPRPLKVVAAQPFTLDFTTGVPWYARVTKQRMARLDPEQAELLALLDAMNADVTVPFMSGGVVLGWLNLRDEGWSDGFSADELLRVQDVAQLSSTVLSNIQDFQALEEEHRLAALGAMATGLAHEIRNPLAGMKGAAQYLQAEHLSEEDREMLQVILDEVTRLDTVVSQFLDYARPFELKRSPEPLNAIVTHVLRLVRAQGLPTGVTLREDLSGDLPTFPVDSPKLSQVLINLAQNAVQAMPGGGALTVATRRRRNRGGHPVAEVLVTDTGLGIPPDHRENLFVPFFTTKTAGTGLGLAISQRIVQAHGGEIDVQTAEGQGSTFIVRLPLPEDDEVPSRESVR